jgi:hypothetical protein
MTPGGWINLILSVGFVTGLLAWCLRRMLACAKSDRSLARVEPVEKDEAAER